MRLPETARRVAEWLIENLRYLQADFENRLYMRGTVPEWTSGKGIPILISNMN
jgi:hypothetical protein